LAWPAWTPPRAPTLPRSTPPSDRCPSIVARPDSRSAGPSWPSVCRMRVATRVLLVVALGLTACARVQPHVLLPNVQLGEPSFFPTLEAYANAPITARNSVDVLLNGEQISRERIAPVRAARTSITYAQYYFEHGPVARDLIEALAERCRAGVGASILLDAFGALDMPAEYIDRMKAAGCHVVMFRPLSPLRWDRTNRRNHRRILVV